MAIIASFMVFISSSVRHAGINTTVVVYWLDIRKNSKPLEDYPLRLDLEFVLERMSHLVECFVAHVAHDF
jgi:hypothetical protein